MVGVSLIELTYLRKSPMKKVSTQKLCKGSNDGEVVVPAKSTLDFIKQFARTYYVEKSLPKTINGYCIN